MLPRVSLALLKFVSPVPTRPQGPNTGAAAPFERFSDGSEGSGQSDSSGHREGRSPQLRAVPGGRNETAPPGGDSERSSALLTLVSSQAPPGTVPSVATAFLDLFQLVRRQRGNLIRWTGVKQYREAVKAFGRTLRVRKGAMLDQKAE